MIAKTFARRGPRAKDGTPPENVRTDPRVDAHLASAPEFARPIFGHLRTLIHATCPGLEETMRWGRPTFVYKGQLLCSMAAFKAHFSLGFWHAGMEAVIARGGHWKGEESSGQFGRIMSLADLPDDAALRHYFAEAIKLHDTGKPPRPRPAPTSPRPEIPVPDDFAALLKTHPAADTAFKAFAPSHRREYLEWITEARREETRAKRMATAVEWLTQGKARHWKYGG